MHSTAIVNDIRDKLKLIVSIIILAELNYKKTTTTEMLKNTKHKIIIP